jgi:AbrB family looped-hinge helix DNA binding protein
MSSRGRITVPLEVRRKLGLEQGDWVVFKPTERGVLVRKADEIIEDLYGSIPPLKVPWKKAREMAWRARAERIVGSSAADA